MSEETAILEKKPLCLKNFLTVFTLSAEAHRDQGGTAECVATLERCKQVDVEGVAKVKEIENKIKNAKAVKEQEMKAAKAELEKCKKVAAETRSKWNLMKQDEESLKLELQELEQSIETTQNQIATCTEVIQQYEEQEKSLAEQVALSKVSCHLSFVLVFPVVFHKSSPLYLPPSFSSIIFV
ncbi:Structural maintenance of chromosomes protein 2 [Portunus trituberculatus]|uniref:Structural maintenance of chromosomes protein 2 n=1 Tax=Portunus trituberculatus TaxID=210409 RepID=A0A5B7G5B9_PORTR|nr:Structural maintenance of chromosomes protein 2 [Portunus trituberculatus]